MFDRGEPPKAGNPTVFLFRAIRRTEMPNQQPNGDPKQGTNQEPKQEPNQGTNQEPNQQPGAGAGESGDNAGAAQPDYGMILDMIKDVQSNQAVIMGKLKTLSDAQSILVDSGAVIHEGSDPDSGVQTNFSNDGFISLDKMDLSI